MYRDALRPAGFADANGFEAQPLERILELQEAYLPNLTSWADWMAVSRRSRRISVLILEHCRGPEEPVWFASMTPELRTTSKACLTNSPSDYPFKKTKKKKQNKNKKTKNKNKQKNNTERKKGGGRERENYCC